MERWYLKQCREKVKKTQADVASELGCSPTAYATLEQGKRPWLGGMRTGTLIKLAGILDTSFTTLVDEEIKWMHSTEG